MASFLMTPTLLLVALQAVPQTAVTADPLSVLVMRMEQAILNDERAEFMALGVPGWVEHADGFWRDVSPFADRVVIKERDRRPLPDGSQQLLLEILTVHNQEGRVATWNAVVRPGAAAGDGPPTGWQLARLDKRSAIAGLYRLSLDTSRQYEVSRLTISAPDLDLSMAAGTAFLATIPDGATAVVLLGRGTMTFTPPDEGERTQMRLFAGATAMQEPFDLALLRVNPDQFAPILASGRLTPTAVTAADVRRATDYFEDTIGRAMTLDLSDLSRDRWSLIPPDGDLLAEVRTRNFGLLTYGRTYSQSEDVILFDRRARKNISSYPSREKLAERGRFYSEDEAIDYDIESIALDTDIDPNRSWIDGNATLVLRTRATVTSLMLKLAESLVVRSLTSDEHGRLTFLRISGQDSIIVKLPDLVPADGRLTLHIGYGGRLGSQALSPDAAEPPPQEQAPVAGVEVTPEPRYIYSTGSSWYPQSLVRDYSTARLRISVPPDYRVVASGRPASGLPVAAVTPAGRQRRTAYEFDTDRPIPYLACVVSRFTVVSETSVSLATGSVALDVVANNRQVSRARELTRQTESILRFYVSLLGDAPYAGLTVAVSESDTPGGHGPSYVALVDQTLMRSPLAWRNDPVSFAGYPPYFLAHELAHQWWGQAVGGKNYHERWISEGFAQYFAAMYAERERGAETFSDILRQMRRSAIDVSDQGPISLGYRLGHIRGDSRVFRAILYNKSAMVLHMLRRLVGDPAFFEGLRLFYREFTFRKAGTDDFRLAMERASGSDLGAFFDGWIFGSDIPRLNVSRTASSTELIVTFEHTGRVLPVPVTVTIVYTDGSSEHVMVPVTQGTVRRVIPLRDRLRDVKIDDDHAALATFAR